MMYDVISINLLVNPLKSAIPANHVFLLLLFCRFPHKKSDPSIISERRY